MNQSFNRQSNYFNGQDDDNSLLKYLQSLSPEAIAHLSQPQSSEVFQVMERNITGLLGNLPAEGFGVMVSTSRDNLGKLLASAMMSGYLLRNAEQRMDFEKALLGSDDSK
ncbi:MAG: DUF760 domain-containing protein [Cyanobacterium sp.]